MGHTCSVYCFPTNWAISRDKRAGRKAGDLSGVGQLQLKSHTVFLGNPFWASLPSMNLLGHTSTFISDSDTGSHSLLHSQAESDNDLRKPLQCYYWSGPPKSHNASSNLHLPLRI